MYEAFINTLAITMRMSSFILRYRTLSNNIETKMFLLQFISVKALQEVFRKRGLMLC